MGLYDAYLQRTKKGPAAPQLTVGANGQPIGQGGLSGGFRGPGDSGSKYVNNYLVPQTDYRANRAGQAQGRYDQALSDPTAQAAKFSDFFKTAADAYGAQANRDFGNTLARTQANTAARFGGNASSEEQRNVYNTSDLFARNLTEQLAGYAPQAAQMGLNYTSQLGQAANQASGEYDDLSRLILSGIGLYPQPKPKGGSLLGGIAGGLAGAFLGPVAGAAGAKLGSNLFGGGK